MGVWMHTTKGRIVGDVMRRDHTFTWIKLAEDAWADVRHRHRDPAGFIGCYRTSRLVEFVTTSDPKEETR